MDISYPEVVSLNVHVSPHRSATRRSAYEVGRVRGARSSKHNSKRVARTHARMARTHARTHAHTQPEILLKNGETLHENLGAKKKKGEFSRRYKHDQYELEQQDIRNCRDLCAVRWRTPQELDSGPCFLGVPSKLARQSSGKNPEGFHGIWDLFPFPCKISFPWSHPNSCRRNIVFPIPTRTVPAEILISHSHPKQLPKKYCSSNSHPNRSRGNPDFPFPSKLFPWK